MALEESKFITKDGDASGGFQPVKSTSSGEGYIDLDTLNSYNYSAGRMSYDPISKTVLADTGFEGVRVNIGQENHIRFYNDTGATITNGTVLNASGVNATNDVFTVVKADSSDLLLSSAVIGISTTDVLDGEIGLATTFGEVRGFDTSSLIESTPLYLSDTVPGTLTNIKPTFPSIILVVGSALKSDASDGIIFVDVTRFQRYSANKSYGFTSQGIGAGTYWKAGFYEFETSDTTLTQSSTTQIYGTSGRSYAAHPAIVPSGPGTVNAGQVGLRVTGIKDSEEGQQVAGQTDIITDDITSLTANQYYEAVGKFSGQITFELYIVSGSPTAYSLTFNYGYAKYEDFGNRNVTVNYFEAVWQGNGNDSNFDVALMHHKADGWTYSASNFIPGNGDICRQSVDQALAGDVANNLDGSYKRTSLAKYVEGSKSEGIIVQVVTGINSTIQIMDIHVQAYSEELTR